MSGPIFADRVKETTTTTGTGTITLAGAATGYQSFAAVGDGNSCYYCETDGTNWEVILGTYTASGTTLSKTTILSSSNSGSAVTWGPGSKDVFLVTPAAISAGWVRISSVVTSGSQTTVDFSSIPSYYKALKVYWLARDTASGTSLSSLRCKLNNDGTALNYTSTFRLVSVGNGVFATTTASSTQGVQVGVFPNDGNTAGIAGAGEIFFPSYGSTNFHKRMISTTGEDDASNTSFNGMLQARWASTAAVNEITFGTDGTAFKDGSEFHLLGLL